MITPGARRFRLSLSSISAGVYYMSVFALLFQSIVLPNSMRMLNLLLLGWTAILSLRRIQLDRRHTILGAFYLSTMIVTTFYTLIGLVRDAPLAAVLQTMGVYVITPLLWMIVAMALLQRFGVVRIANWLKHLSYPCLLSIVLFIVLFTVYGPDSVSLFKQKANVNIHDGRAAANMHVYGSLIFITGGIFFSPRIVGSRVERYVLMGLLIAAVATSGRTAMFLALVTGFILRMVGSPLAPASRKREVNDRMSITNFIVFALLLFVVHLFFISYFSIDVVKSLILFAEDIGEGGGSIRGEQLKAFWSAIMDSQAIGVGHGIGMEDYVRDENNNWRYELLLPASMYRVGVIGTMVYVAPFAFALVKAGKLQLKGALNEHERFILGGYVAFLLAAGTNPYIEAISFQWMVVIPMVYFTMRKRDTSGRLKVRPGAHEQ